MLRGHVDTVTRQKITGWAADDEFPDAIIQVSIFVNGHKVAQIPCDTPRPDLVQAGLFGQSPHGFAYEFPERLADESDWRVLVRYTMTGKLLNRGDAMIHRDNRVVIRPAPVGQTDIEPEQLPVPSDPRSVFESLVLFDEKVGLYELLNRMRFSTETSRDVYYSVFGRSSEIDSSPRNLGAPSAARDYSPRDHLNDLLLSREFQRNVVPLFLNAFPEKRRIVFIHVPKCAGTDLSTHLMRRFPSMHQTVMEERWTSKERLFQRIARLMLHIRFSDNIFLCGHSSLDYYVSRGLLRPIDRAFTIVRPPLEIAVSHVNYILTRITRDIAAQKIGPDVKEWMAILGVDTLPANIPAELLQTLCSAIVHSAELVKPNSMCSWLGGTDAQEVIEQLRYYDVEITTVDQYSRWLRQQWAISTDTRMNRSEPFVSLNFLADRDIAYLQEIYAEDTKLYAVIHVSMERTGASFIKGEELRVVV